MSVNSTSNVDPTLVNQNRNTENLANTETEDENIYAGAIPSNNAEVATQTVETVAISDIEASNEISSLDEPEDIPEFTNKAAEGYNGETDAQLATDITAQILAGADIDETFNAELLKIADERYGANSYEQIGQTTDDNGDIVQNYLVGETGEEFSITQHQYNETYGMKMSSLNFDDDSNIQLFILDGAVGGAGIHRVSGEKEDGTKDFTKVTEYMIQEGTASIVEDHNGNQVYQENYNQINRYDGTTQNDNSTTYHNNGMLTTEYEKDGVDYLYVANGNHSASKVFSSEDDFTNAVESKYAVLGENGFVSDWDDGSNVDTSDPLYRDFNNKLDPFMAELLAEINDPSAVGEVDGVDGTEEIDDNEDGELSTESSSVVDTELLDQGLIDENGNPIEQDTTNTVANNTETNNNPDETGDINQSDDSTDDEIQNQQNLPNTTDE